MKNAQNSGSVSTSLGARMFWEYYLKSVLPYFPIIPSRSCVRSLPPLQPFSPGVMGIHPLTLWGCLWNSIRLTSVWKALLTVMHAWFIKWLQENGGGGRVPNTARAFIFDITKRSLAKGQTGVYGNIKCRHVLSVVGGAPEEGVPCSQTAFHFHRMHSY